MAEPSNSSDSKKTGSRRFMARGNIRRDGAIVGKLPAPVNLPAISRKCRKKANLVQ